MQFAEASPGNYTVTDNLLRTAYTGNPDVICGSAVYTVNQVPVQHAPAFAVLAVLARQCVRQPSFPQPGHPPPDCLALACGSNALIGILRRPQPLCPRHVQVLLPDQLVDLPPTTAAEAAALLSSYVAPGPSPAA